MNPSLWRGALRAVAIAIAVTALIDPVLTVARTRVPPVVLIDLTDGEVTAVASAMGRAHPEADVEVRTAEGHRLPCEPGERCVAVVDGSVKVAVPADLKTPWSLITTAETRAPNVRLRSVVMASAQHAAAAGLARVVAEGIGVAGRRTTITISDGNAVVGNAAIDWNTDGTQSVEVPWWPIGPGPRSLRIEAATDGDVLRFDDEIDAGIDVASGRLPVMVYDARPSWGSAFVRRALEDDRRFLVEHRARLAPALSAGTANARLDERALDDAAVLIVGGLDALTAHEVDLIDRFVRVRGGTAVLLPERMPYGPVTRLFDRGWVERLLTDAQNVGPLRASELLVYPANAGHNQVLAESGETPTIVATPTGAGRVIVSGAMDAWRYRDADNGAFDRFWRSIVAEGVAAGMPLRLDFETTIAVPGSRQPFLLRYRAMSPASAIEANAVATCGGTPARALRLWPAGPPGVLRGELPVGQGACTVEAAVNDTLVTRGIAVIAAPSRAVDDTLAALEQAARRSGGDVTDEDNLGAIARHTPVTPEPTPVWPMRSAWWMVPFAGCLAAEWWLRRRTGIR